MTPAQKPRTLGRYELLELLGRGSAMEAFRAKSFGVEGFEKTLVVKRLLPELASSPEFTTLFLENVQRAMRLSHANLAQVFDLGHADEDGKPAYFFATEFVSGLDVATLLGRSRAASEAPPVALATYLGLEVAKALDHAHRRRDEQLEPLAIAHGSVAAHNVLVSFDGDVKLTDFGVTRALLMLPGPWEPLRRLYAASSPEQARGGPPTVVSDVFSLGTFLYAALAGRPPFEGPTAPQVRENVLRGQFQPLESVRADIPGPLADVVHRALAPEPEDRFSSVSAMYEELLACTYACGLRYSAGDLAGFVDHYREAPATVPAEAIDALLSRPLTVPPRSREPDTVPEQGSFPSLTTIPPLTGFGDLRHVSVLVLRLGQEGPLPDLLRARALAIIDRYGGSVVSEGDGEITALFGLDHSDGRDTEIAVRAGLVLARGLDVGDVAPAVGIDTGRLRIDPDLRPAPDDRTARLVAAARALASEGERAVVVSRRAASSLRGRFPLEPFAGGLSVREFAQDGFTDPFVGRKAELTHLGETLVVAARGQLRLIAIAGEPGVGKTRLAVEMQRRLSRGSIDLRTFFGTCPPRGRELPNSGLVAMLRRMCGVRDGDPPERIEALEPRLRALGLDTDEVHAVQGALGGAPVLRPSAPSDFRSAFVRMMQSLAEDRFTVFVWDDAHELDAASCDLLGRVVARLGSSRLAIVLSSRRDAGAPYLALPIHTELELGELQSADVERLIALRIGVDDVPAELLEFLRDRAGGQPMFIEELLRELEDSGAIRTEGGRVTALSLGEGVPVPRTLRALTHDRLSRLSPDERHLFVAAAVLEPPASVAALARMVGLPVSVVDGVAEPLVLRGFLGRDGPDAFGFPSPLAREVVLAELDPLDLRNLHRRAAEAHAALAGGLLDEEADRIGYHLAAAGDRDAAAEQYARSGLHYVALQKLDRAALDLAYALDLTDLETRGSGQIENWLRALSAAVRYVRTGPHLPALIDRLVERVDGGAVELPLRAEMRVHLACILGALDQQLVAEALLERGASDASAGPDIVVAMLAAHADLASSRGDFRLARRALDPLARMTIKDRGDVHRVTLSMARTLASAGKSEAAEAALSDAERVAARGDPLLSLDRAAVRTQIHAQAGRFREAADAAVQAASQAEELGFSYELASSLSEQAAALARLGESARARAAVASALAVAEEAGAERVIVRCRLVLGYLEGVDGGFRALDAQRGHVAFAESHGWISDSLLGRYFLGRAAIRLGAVDVARTELLLASRIAASTGNQAQSDQCTAELMKLG
jgi:serine/threonine protein kinase/tetratricopeptide (TPR) repeat protein